MAINKKYSQAARVQGILRTLGARHGITRGELAEEFGVMKRTLYRDLKALEDSGYPLCSEIIEGTTYAYRVVTQFAESPQLCQIT